MNLKKGCGVFGKEYEVMFLNDLHDTNSMDQDLIRNMILIDDKSIDELYSHPKITQENIINHELFQFAQRFKDDSGLKTIQNALDFTEKIVTNYNVSFEDMLFGGTEKEIIERGTDWCSDISRVGCALLQCLNIPARIVFLVNKSKAYNGHTVVEAYIDHHYILCDFTYGVKGYLSKFYSIRDLLSNTKIVEEVYRIKVKDNNHLNYICGLFDVAAISEYDCSKNHAYNISKPNEYYLRLIDLKQNGKWQLGE